MDKSDDFVSAFRALNGADAGAVPLKGYRHPQTGQEVYWVRADEARAAALGYEPYTPHEDPVPHYVLDRPAAGAVPLYVYVRNKDAVFGQPLPAPAPDIQTLRGRLLSDQATDHDLLGYDVYAAAIVELIRTNVDEVPPAASADIPAAGLAEPAAAKLGRPFNIGIIAPWGHGKTTLMQKIRLGLDGDYLQQEAQQQEEIRTDDHRSTDKKARYGHLLGWVHGLFIKSEKTVDGRYPTVWFNAWRYQSSNQIWAGIGHAVITGLSARLSPVEREKFWLKLQLGRVNMQRVRQAMYGDLIRKLLPWLAATALACCVAVAAFVFHLWESPNIGWLPGTTALLTAGRLFWLTRKRVDGKVSVYLEEPDYSGKLGVYHEIIEDLHKVFSLLLGDRQRAVVFIDDLDRCSPTVIAEVFEAVNLMMVDPIIGKNCYFIFGMDAQVVAAALDQKYAMMAGKLRAQEESFGSVGWYFLDKFIQLPFHVPIMSGEERLNFLKHYFRPETAAGSGKPAGTKEQAKQEVKKVMQDPDTARKQERLAGILGDPALQPEVKQEALRVAVKEKLQDNDSDEILDQLAFISPFLSSSPREIIRYINLLRFFNTTLFVRQSLARQTEPVAFKGVAKYLLLALKWPQLVRWIQWEGEDDLVLYNTTLEKAMFLDRLIDRFRKQTAGTNGSNGQPAPESTAQLHEQWCALIDQQINAGVSNGAARKLPWLYDKQLLEVLLNPDTREATFEKALRSKMW